MDEGNHEKIKEITISRIARNVRMIEDRLKLTIAALEQKGVGAMNPGPQQLSKIWKALEDLHTSFKSFENETGNRVFRNKELE